MCLVTCTGIAYKGAFSDSAVRNSTTFNTLSFRAGTKTNRELPQTRGVMQTLIILTPRHDPVMRDKSAEFNSYTASKQNRCCTQPGSEDLLTMALGSGYLQSTFRRPYRGHACASRRSTLKDRLLIAAVLQLSSSNISGRLIISVYSNQGA